MAWGGMLWSLEWLWMTKSFISKITTVIVGLGEMHESK